MEPAALQIGLGIIEAEGKAMKCYENPAESLSLSVMGASTAILKANYSIDSFMARYRRVEWLDKKNWGCNQRCNLQSQYPQCLQECLDPMLSAATALVIIAGSCCQGYLSQQMGIL